MSKCHCEHPDFTTDFDIRLQHPIVSTTTYFDIILPHRHLITKPWRRLKAMEDKENNPSAVKAHGAIVKIVFSNFLTYDKVTCVPGPFLNVIIGPNGTGKSTIICGICLAVGGSPNILGRSDNFADFIKHGKDEDMLKYICGTPRGELIEPLKS
uniref:Structural maintenance of chromosomes protein 5 n=1 Tax=Ditylenchus dipsaci TaxID=166011 RepID=A0A915D3K9_9BILA